MGKLNSLLMPLIYVPCVVTIGLLNLHLPSQQKLMIYANQKSDTHTPQSLLIFILSSISLKDKNTKITQLKTTTF